MPHAISIPLTLRLLDRRHVEITVHTTLLPRVEQEAQDPMEHLPLLKGCEAHFDGADEDLQWAVDPVFPLSVDDDHPRYSSRELRALLQDPAPGPARTHETWTAIVPRHALPAGLRRRLDPRRCVTALPLPDDLLDALSRASWLRRCRTGRCH